ncbi:MAG: hypothetical protein ACWGMZ_02565, partial [Thermoguttaceae bacterium]
ISGFTFRRWPNLIRESLFPISRRDFAREQIRGGMFDMAMVALGVFAGIILGLIMFQPQMLLEITPLYILIAISQFFMVGFAVIWMVSFRDIIESLLGSIGIAIVSMTLILSAIWGRWMLSSASIVLSAAAAIGFYRLAFCRWCNIELD